MLFVLRIDFKPKIKAHRQPEFLQIKQNLQIQVIRVLRHLGGYFLG